MMKTLITAGLIFLLNTGNIFAFFSYDSRNLHHKIDFEIGGESPKSHGIIEKPVLADAQIRVKAQGRIVITGFFVEYRKDSKTGDNSPIFSQPGAEPKIDYYRIHPIADKAPFLIVFDAPNGSLSQTVDGKALEPGKYLAYIISSQGMMQIIFDVV